MSSKIGMRQFQSLLEQKKGLEEEKNLFSNFEFKSQSYKRYLVQKRLKLVLNTCTVRYLDLHNINTIL